MSKLVLRGSCILALIVFALPAASQVQNGEITGTVIDPSGAVVPGAKIVLQNLSTRYEIQTQTNSAGIYTAKELAVGLYKLTLEAAGFKSATSSGVEVNAGTVLRVDFKLQVGERRETVEVTEAPVMINSENSRLAQTVDSTQIANLRTQYLRSDPVRAGCD